MARKGRNRRIGGPKRRQPRAWRPGDDFNDAPQALKDSMEANFRQFVEKFGREPTADDPVMFDPDEDVPTQMPIEKLNAQMIITMIRAGVPQVLIYTYIRTGGMIVAEVNKHHWSPEDLALWDKAVGEFERTFGDEGEEQEEDDPDGRLDDD